MKILHILDHSLPLHSGYTFRSQNIFKAQKRMGYHPVVLTSPKHEQSLKKEAPYQETINTIRYYRTGRIKTIPFPMVSEIFLMRRLYHRIMQIAATEKPAVIHAHSPLLNGLPAIWAARKLKIPLVYEIRAFWEDAAVDHGTYTENSWKYRLTQFLETQVCRHADHVCVLCNNLKMDLMERCLLPEKITPVFNGIDPDELKPVPPDGEYMSRWNLKDKKVIGFVGSFYRYEGLDLLMESFSRLTRRHKDVQLLLVGGGEMEKELITLGGSLEIEDRLIMPGRIPHDRIAGVYSLIDILAYPRYSMRLTELVTPLKPLEAMAMGKAFVASNVGGHRELIRNGQTGMLFKAGCSDGLEKCLERLLTDQNLRATIGDKGKKWVRENHTWPKTTSVYEQVYRTIHD